MTPFPRFHIHFSSIEQARRFYAWRRWGMAASRAARLVQATILVKDET